jgi:hypothetical protein
MSFGSQMYHSNTRTPRYISLTSKSRHGDPLRMAIRSISYFWKKTDPEHEGN